MAPHGVDRIPSRVDTYLFDLDGTLVDSARRIRSTLRKTLQNCLGLSPDEDEIAGHTGVSLADIMRSYEPKRVEELVEYYRDYYASIGPTPPFPGIVDILRSLRERDCRLAVVTTKGRESAEDHLREADLVDYFPVVITSNEVTHPKPSPEPVELALSLLRSSPRRAIMIGDARADILSGKSAGTLTGWARWGTDRLLHFDGIRPDYVWREPCELMRDLPRRTE
ncbi:MAG: HAD-IA family hydrolase [Clostridia bacterium]